MMIAATGGRLASPKVSKKKGMSGVAPVTRNVWFPLQGRELLHDLYRQLKVTIHY
jgi:hypothetical protein